MLIKSSLFTETPLRKFYLTVLRHFSRKQNNIENIADAIARKLSAPLLRNSSCCKSDHVPNSIY